jgi:hypothetical protein
MGKFSVTRALVALNTANDTLTFIAASGRRIKIYEVIVGGLATASAANVVQVSRSTGGTTGGGALTPQAIVSDQAASITVVNTTWVAQPTLAAGGPLLRLPVNSNGGVFRWVARPGDEIEARNAEQISIRSETGTGNISITVLFEEL